jgi:serine/threonine-protein kinase
MLDPEKHRIYLMDLGIAKFMSGSLKSQGYTVGFRSPEQYYERGINLPSDIYSIGATLFKLLTGVDPIDVKDRVEGKELPKPCDLQPSISEKMESFILKAMQLDKADRHRNIQAMLDELQPQLEIAERKKDFARKFDQIISEYGRFPAELKQHLEDLYQDMTEISLPLERLAIRNRGRLLGMLSGALLSVCVVGVILGLGISLQAINFGQTIPVVRNVVVTSPVIAVKPTRPPPQPAPSALDSQLLITLTPSVEIELVRVPAGYFIMGRPITDTSAAVDDRSPQPRINLDTFLIGKYEITNGQFEPFARKNLPDWELPEGTDNQPVTNVTWDEARLFCAWLSQMSGRKVQLPSEAQWEKAARGTDGRQYPWGNQVPDGGRANYSSALDDTAPVGSHSPQGDSVYDAADMAGNAAEWTSSLFMPYPYNASDGREVPDSRAQRVVRGGGFSDVPADLRTTVRVVRPPENRDPSIGFRIVVLP